MVDSLSHSNSNNDVKTALGLHVWANLSVTRTGAGPGNQVYQFVQTFDTASSSSPSSTARGNILDIKA